MEDPKSSLEEVKQLLNGVNLDSLSSDILSVIMSTLSYDEVKYVCSLNKRLSDLCKRRGVIDLKARQIAAHEAPLGTLVQTQRSHVDLIQRGLKTVYNAHYRKPNDTASFGLADVRKTGLVEFEIVGLPPPKGTIVWVMSFESLGELNPSVFGSLDELKVETLSIIRGRNLEDYAIQHFVDDGALNETDYEQEIQAMIEASDKYESYYGLHLRQITLP